jgi:hypothetical protein
MNNWEKVRDFVSNETGIAKEKLSSESRIEQDLYITGDDARELLESFVDTFKVNYDGFELGDFFGTEGFDPLGLGGLIRRLRGERKAASPTSYLMLDDLVKWVDRGYWIDPVR